METRNITLALSKELLQKAKVLAAQRGTSISRLVGDLLEDLVGREDDFAGVWAREKALMKRGLNMRVGHITWTRDEIHER